MTKVCKLYWQCKYTDYIGRKGRIHVTLQIAEMFRANMPSHSILLKGNDKVLYSKTFPSVSLGKFWKYLNYIIKCQENLSVVHSMQEVLERDIYI